MADDEDNIIRLEPRIASRERWQQEENDRQRRDGKKILDRRDQKLALRDRETLARALWYRLQDNGVPRNMLAHQCGLDPKELYRRVLGPSEDPRPNRLRAGFPAYRELIVGLAKCTNIDQRLLANQIAYGTSLHPSSGPAPSEIEWIKRQLYDLAEGVDAEYQLSTRFAALSEKKRWLPQSSPFACWPNGGSGIDDFHRDFWAEVAPGDTIVEDTGLLAFLRYVPHFFIGISASFDQEWPIPESPSNRPGNPFGPFLPQHPDGDVYQERNRLRLAETVGDVSRLQLEWDGGAEHLSINGKSEQEYVDANWAHLESYLLDVGVDPDPARYRGDVVCEHSTWICLYPSRQAAPGLGSVANLIPVIVQNYGYGGGCGEITLEEADLWLDAVVGSKLISGLTVGERLVEALSAPNEAIEPELKAELRRTAPFVEHHPLLRCYRHQQAGERHIRAYREEKKTRSP